MRSLSYILTFLGLTLLISCSSSSIDFNIQGTRVVETGMHSNEFLIIKDNLIDTIDLTSFPHDFGTPYLNNSKEFLFLEEKWKNKKLGCYNNQIVRLNIKGELIDTIYVAQKNEDIQSYTLSPDNQEIFICSNDYFAWWQTVNFPFDEPKKVDSSKFIIEYKLINLREKEIVKRFSMKSSFDISYLAESSWSPDSKRILIYNRDIDNSKADEKIVVLDLVTLDTTHVDHGKNAIWSTSIPSEIFYTKGKELLKYNLDSKQKTRILKLNYWEKYKDLRFTPDGRYLYFNYWKDRFCNKLFGDIVCYPINAYGKVYDLERMKSKRIKGHRNLDTWKY